VTAVVQVAAYAPNGVARYAHPLTD